MKRICLLTMTILMTSLAYAQNFEGKIIYNNSFKSKSPQITGEQLTVMMGDNMEYYIKEGNYKSTTNGSFVQWQLYVNKDNKLYNKMSNSETVYWNDASVNEDPVVNATVNKGVAEIMGHKCDELILVCKSGVQKYYFNSKFAVSPAYFTNHKYGNWYEFISRSSAVPLKSVIDNSQFTMESTATEIKPMKLDLSFFALPPGVKTEKNPY